MLDIHVHLAVGSFDKRYDTLGGFKPVENKKNLLDGNGRKSVTKVEEGSNSISIRRVEIAVDPTNSIDDDDIVSKMPSRNESLLEVTGLNSNDSIQACSSGF